jgi:uncharacterized protein
MFLMKVASRCNLACPYCYVYELRDQGWRSQPTFMKESTLRVVLQKIREHVVSNSLPAVSVIFHGGEPLLIGPERLNETAALVRQRLSDVTEVRLGLQTNGTLFDERILDVAIRQQIRVGLSVDGPPAHHDRFRFDHQGGQSSHLVERAAKLLRANPEVFGGILCVISLKIDPPQVFDYLSTLGSKSIDLLLPHATHDYLPPDVVSRDEIIRYGEWLIQFLERWYRSGDDRPDIRFFSSIMRLLLGRTSLVESIGLGVSTLIVVESNGDIEAVDALKTCYQGAAWTGLNVFQDSFSDALRTPAIVSRQMGSASLSSICQRCSFVKVCGGGYQPHRYSAARGFLNPSVYCDVLQSVIQRIAMLIRNDLQSIEVATPTLVEELANARFNSQTI